MSSIELKNLELQEVECLLQKKLAENNDDLDAAING